MNYRREIYSSSVIVIFEGYLALIGTSNLILMEIHRTLKSVLKRLRNRRARCVGQQDSPELEVISNSFRE